MQHLIVYLLSILFGVICFASNAQALVVLQYHHIDNETPAATSITPERFREHLAFLEQQHFRVIAITELPALLKAAKPSGSLPDRTAVITFDDGYSSIYEQAFPLLKARNWPFTVFVNSKPHDQKNPQYASWKQLREMAAEGATIANHSDSHQHMIRRLDGESAKQWLARQTHEIEFTEQRIRKEIGGPAAPFFAYPFGEYNNELVALLESKGYLGFTQISGPIAANSSPQLLPRFVFGGPYGRPQDFADKVMSLPFPLLDVLVSDEAGRPLNGSELPPAVTVPRLQLQSPILRLVRAAQCFASGQGQLAVALGGSSLTTKANRPLSAGRSRYTCTAAAGGGRFYWYSTLFIRRKDDGGWYSE
ncbi:polysaccharide deacetylase family protein [Teredinibacter waterburyi]|uniref:polysaccharide deacetylase family protein n=1 Tax=Teredinibacter waterburyi TaxID=1500538 RepID=UPI00165FB777|nr:polysaccharide deacetylase family protein [Teredinibacter waterburyi]